MNFDVNTLMTLMSMTGGQGMSGNMQNLLPLLMTMMNKNNAPPSCEQGRPQSFGGASGNGYGTESNQNAFKNNFSQKNWYYDRVMEKNNFYASQLFYSSNAYVMEPFHVLYPIPLTAISSNTQGVINQNQGYFGCENNIPIEE